MNGYLQRLLDRTAPVTPPGSAALPAGLSHSPVSLSDRRLSDPDFSSSFAPTTDTQQTFDDTTPTITRPAPKAELHAEPQSGPRQTTQQAIAETTPSQPATSLLEPESPWMAETTQTTPESKVTETPLQHPRPTGLVKAEDLVLPQVDPVVNTDEPAFEPYQKILPVPPLPQTESTEPPSPQSQETSTPPKMSPEFTVATPAPPRPQAEPITPMATSDLPERQESQTDSAVAEPRRAIAVMPTPVETPVLPDISPPAARQSNRAPAVQAVPEATKSAPPNEARRVGPKTAAQASIIGQLIPRRRALTLFGLRRR